MNLKNSLVSSVILSSLTLTLFPSQNVEAQTKVPTNVLSSEEPSKSEELPSTELPITEEVVTDIITSELPTTEEMTVSKPVIKTELKNNVKEKKDNKINDKVTTELPTTESVKSDSINKNNDNNSSHVVKVDVPTTENIIVNNNTQWLGLETDKATLKNTLKVPKQKSIKSIPKDTKLKKTIENGVKENKDIEKLTKNKDSIIKTKEEQEKELAEREKAIKLYEDRIKLIQENKEKLKIELKKLDVQIKENKEKINKVDAEKDRQYDLLLELKKRHEITQKDRDEKLKSFKERIASLQRSKTFDFELLQGSSSLTDTKVKLEQYKNLSINDKKLLDELSEVIERLDIEAKEIDVKVDILREHEKKLDRLEGQLLETQSKQNIVLKSLNQKQIILENNLHDEKNHVDGLNKDIDDLTETELEVVQSITTIEDSSLNESYQKYLDEIKEKRKAVEQAIAKDTLAISKLKDKERLSAYDRVLISKLESKIQKNKQYLEDNNSEGFLPPTKGIVTSTVGYRYLFQSNHFHSGVDIANSIGTNVYSTASGIVTYAGAINNGYGNVITIEHNIGGKVYTSLYGHLSAIGVKAGDKVERGELIGLMGNEGRSTGPHLHFELYDAKKTDWSYNNLINPLDFMSKSDFN